MEDEEEEMEGSQVSAMFHVRDCVIFFPLEIACTYNLQIFTSLLPFFLFNQYVFNYLFPLFFFFYNDSQDQLFRIFLSCVLELSTLSILASFMV